ncbi:MAG: HAMP domain-containing sensor histidine kinase [Caulobacter sp.]|nr:HAMP domain-containing sensor histidine kinase [Caulobacter sp.]
MTRTAQQSAAPLQSDQLGQVELPAKRDKALDETRRAFLRMVSHELRTPLNAIIGFSEIIARELYGPLGAPQYREYAEHVRQSGYRLLKLVNQVLEIARLQGGDIDLDLEARPLVHLLDDVSDKLREDLKARGVTLRIENEDAMPSVLVDEKGARNLLFNLIQNGVLHGRAGGVVDIRARREGDRVEIEIQDDGDGVDPAELPRLLAPFEQDEAVSRSADRSGLGLPIARLLAEAMGGDLRLSCRPGEGLTAHVTLPAA